MIEKTHEVFLGKSGITSIKKKKKTGQGCLVLVDWGVNTVFTDPSGYRCSLIVVVVVILLARKRSYIFHSNKYCKRKPMSAEVLSWGSILGSMKRIRKTREYEDFSKSS